MRYLTSAALVLMAVLLAAGPVLGGQSKTERQAELHLKNLKALNGALAGVKDAASLKAGLAAVGKLAGKAEASGKQFDASGEPASDKLVEAVTDERSTLRQHMLRVWSGRTEGFANLQETVGGVPALAGDPYDWAMAEQMGMMGELNRILTGIKDAATLKAARAELEGHGKRMREFGNAMKAMGEPPKERVDALKKKYEAVMKKKVMTLFANMMRLATIEGGKDIGKILQDR